jgi:hemerythrin-like domain-containing protein
MKRSTALTPLSHQHHTGLYVALQLKRATAATGDDARRAFLDFFAREGASHFRAEEDVLLPAYAGHAGADDPAIVRVLVEHVELRRRAGDLARSGSTEDLAALHELGERLESHIRHEERVLFPAIEEALSGEELERLAAAFAAAGADDA